MRRARVAASGDGRWIEFVSGGGERRPATAHRPMRCFDTARRQQVQITISVRGDFQPPDPFTLEPCVPASCQLPVSGSLLSVQISGAYPAFLASHQSHSAHHVSPGSDPNRCQSSVKRRPRECGWMHSSGEGKRQVLSNTGGYPRVDWVFLLVRATSKAEECWLLRRATVCSPAQL